MSKEFIWGADVNNERASFRVVVEENECLTYEDDVLTNRMAYTVPETEGEMWIDEVLEIWGKRCRFQLDKGVPYIQMDGKWTASDTTMEDRMLKAALSQKLSGLVQAAIGLLLCLLCGILYLVKPELMDTWWFTAVVGSVMIVGGLLQYRNVKKEFGV